MEWDEKTPNPVGRVSILPIRIYAIVRLIRLAAPYIDFGRCEEYILPTAAAGVIEKTRSWKRLATRRWKCMIDDGILVPGVRFASSERIRLTLLAVVLYSRWRVNLNLFITVAGRDIYTDIRYRSIIIHSVVIQGNTPYRRQSQPLQNMVGI